MNKKKVAFFDIDGTVFRWSVFLYVVEYMAGEGYLDEDIYLKIKESEEKYRNREIDYDVYLMEAVNFFDKNIKGVPLCVIENAGKSAFEKYKDRTYVFSRKLIKFLKDDGYFLVAISQSPKIALDPFCEYYGFDLVYGRRYEADESGKMTGNVLDLELIQEKDKIIERVFENNTGLEYADSISVGDTMGDFCMAGKTKHFIAMNGTSDLIGSAMCCDLDTVVERKNAAVCFLSEDSIIENYFQVFGGSLIHLQDVL